MAFKSPVFLLGLPRSGTTLLSVMLNNHPQVFAPPEPWILLAMETIGRGHPMNPADSSLIGSAFSDFLPRDGYLKALRNFCHELYREKMGPSGKKIFIDKTPRYYLILPFIAELFPDARYIVLRRDPFDVAASYRRSWGVDLAGEIKSGADTPHALDFVIGHSRLDELVSSSASDKVFVLGYEQLVEEPRKHVDEIISFLGCEPAGNLADFDLGGTSHQRSFFGDRNVLQTTSPNRKSVGSWKGLFDKDELNVLLDCLGSGLLRRMGYEATLDDLFALGVVDNGETRARFNRRIFELFLEKRRLAEQADSLFQAENPHGCKEDAPSPDDRLKSLERECAAAGEEVRNLREEVAELKKQFTQLWKILRQSK